MRLPEDQAPRQAHLCLDLGDALTARQGEQPSVAETLACQEIVTARDAGPFRVPGVRIAVPDLLDFVQEGWLTLLDLFDQVSRHWALVGGQMIHLHCWQRGRPAPRVTTDADLIMDIRAKPTMHATVTEFLQDRGFQKDGRSPTNVGHRWKRDRLSFDVLLPDSTAMCPPVRVALSPWACRSALNALRTPSHRFA